MAQVVPSRMQNRRGTQAEFDALYVSGEPDALKLQPGELGFCTDTKRVFIGDDYPPIGDPYTFTEITTNDGLLVLGDTVEFSPYIESLPPAAVWTPISYISLTPNVSISPGPHPGLFNIMYSVFEEIPPLPTDIPFTKSGTLVISSTTVTASSMFAPTSTLSDTGTEINTYPDPKPDISFKSEYTGGTIQISYMHNFASNLQLSTSTLHWTNF